MEVDPIGAQQAPPVSSEAPAASSLRRIRRGACSKAQHDSAFRQRLAGVPASAANNARIDKSLFHQISKFSNNLNFSKFELKPNIYTIPQTTRGLGFAVQQTFNCLQSQIRLNISMPALYRCTLATHWYILQKSGPSREYIIPYSVRKAYLSEDFVKLVEDNTITFRACATALSCFGSYATVARECHGFLPLPGIYYHAKPATADHDVEGIETHSKLNPYTVNFNNLRSVVDELSSITTPVEIRRYFIAHNPIPGAIFDNDLLKNANDIMPPHLQLQQLEADFRALRACISGARRSNTWFSTVNLTAMASAGMFVNIDAPDMRIEDGIIQGASNTRSFCFEKVTAQDYLLGYLSLSGEQCLQQQEHLKVYGPRRRRSSAVRRHLAWDQLVTGLY